MSGKKYSDAVSRYDKQMLHDPVRAVEIVKEMASAKFDEAIDIAVGLGVDPRKADQMVRGTIALPSGTGGDVRVAVFARRFRSERVFFLNSALCDRLVSPM